jgi:hypothetical protein
VASAGSIVTATAKWSSRCAARVMRGRDAELFAGAGIVAGSDPEQELAETEAKLAVIAGLALPWASACAQLRQARRSRQRMTTRRHRPAQPALVAGAGRCPGRRRLARRGPFAGVAFEPLALAFLRQPAIRCQVILDERSAAFFALGMAKASGSRRRCCVLRVRRRRTGFRRSSKPISAAVPLLLLSAARPPELLGWGANQTIDQQQLFGRHVRALYAPPLPMPTSRLPICSAWRRGRSPTAAGRCRVRCI